MSILRIDTPRVFVPLLKPSRYKGAWGGRGSGKSHFFAELGIEHCLMYPGFRLLCVREVQQSLKESVKRTLEDKIQKMGVGDRFNVLYDRIVTPGDGVIQFQGMQDHTAESVKSLEGFHAAWVEEAQTMSERSLEYLRPTIRNPHPQMFQSELWFSWNPRRSTDPVDHLLRKSTPENALVVRANYYDNPFFPKELEQEREYDHLHTPQRYAHIWLGEYEPMAIGSIWEQDTIERHRVKESPRLTRVVVAVDPAVSSQKNSDEHGITVVGLGDDQHGYVLADFSTRGSPRHWAEKAVAAYDLFEADAIVIERNQGGDMCRHTLRSVRSDLPIIDVVATRGKHVRAEPVAALYSLGRIHHVGHFPELEAQMCLMTAGGYEGAGSPDRMDSMVWAVTELFPKIVKREKKPQFNQPEDYGSPAGWMA